MTASNVKLWRPYGDACTYVIGKQIMWVNLTFSCHILCTLLQEYLQDHTQNETIQEESETDHLGALPQFNMRNAVDVSWTIFMENNACHINLIFLNVFKLQYQSTA